MAATTAAPKASFVTVVFAYGFLWFIIVAVMAGVGAGLAALFTGVAPNFTANLVGPLFCPAGSTPAIVTLYGATYRDSDNNVRQQQTQELHCTDAAGKPVTPLREGFDLVWYGGWIGTLVALATLAYVVWAVVDGIAKAVKARAPTVV
jgi:hypothetical protein